MPSPEIRADSLAHVACVSFLGGMRLFFIVQDLNSRRDFLEFVWVCVHSFSQGNIAVGFMWLHI